jgi:hypothetical protein
MARQEEEWKKGRRTTVADLGRHHDDKRAAADVPKNLTLNSRPIKPKAQVGVKKRKEKTSEVAEDVDMDNVDTVPNLGQQTSLDPRPLPSTLLTSTRSAKINFVVRAVLTAPPTDKFVMFGTYDEIAHVHEALSLVGVHSVYAVQKIPSSQRNRAVSDFAKPNIRVIFLELKFAARGLTLTSGNRMIFLSPVWSLDVQAQAIKVRQ